ncbi:hypothetical protein FQZ97_1023990 [compost metagenome]
MCTSWLPCETWLAEVSISSLISLAAPSVRCARLRTSSATTAKPRPCSPARAASTAALSARMLVWNEMLSITWMISPMRLDERLISSMVETTAPMASLPSRATCVA